MYGIFTYIIYPINDLNVGKYSIHGSSEIWVPYNTRTSPAIASSQKRCRWRCREIGTCFGLDVESLGSPMLGTKGAVNSSGKMSTLRWIKWINWIHWINLDGLSDIYIYIYVTCIYIYILGSLEALGINHGLSWKCLEVLTRASIFPLNAYILGEHNSSFRGIRRAYPPSCLYGSWSHAWVLQQPARPTHQRKSEARSESRNEIHSGVIKYMAGWKMDHR